MNKTRERLEKTVSSEKLDAFEDAIKDTVDKMIDEYDAEIDYPTRIKDTIVEAYYYEIDDMSSKLNNSEELMFNRYYSDFNRNEYSHAKSSVSVILGTTYGLCSNNKIDVSSEVFRDIATLSGQIMSENYQ